MNFVNNYTQPVTLAMGATSLALTLPDGEYRLTLTDSATAGTRWEIVGAVVSGGTATLERGMEGTTDQNWPEDSAIYCALTAGLLQSMFARLLPAGGEAGQVLAKISGTDYDAGWTSAGADSGFGGASSGRLFVAYTDTADNVRKAAVIDLVTGDLVVVDAWESLLTDLTPGVLGYSAASGMVAAFPPDSTKLQLFSDPGFAGFSSSSAVSGGSGAAWKADGSIVMAVNHSNYIKPFSFDPVAAPPLQLALAGDGSIPGVSPTVMPVFSPDGAYLYVPGNGIARRNGTTFALIDTVLDESVDQFALSADGTIAAVRSFSFSTYESSIRIVDTSDWSVLATFAAYDQPAIGGDMTVRMAFNPTNAQQLAVAVQSNVGGVDAACVLLDYTSPGAVISLSPAADYDPAAWAGEQVAWSPAGDRLYVACSVGMHAYSAADWSYVGTLPNIESGAPITLP